MGQPGRSIPDSNAPIRSRADYAAWLTATLDALQIDHAYLVGMSYGGWLTLNYAIDAPSRVRRIALLSPAGSFLPLTRNFTVRAVATTLFPTHFIVEKFLHWLTYEENLQDPEVRRLDQSMVELMHLGMKNFRMHPDTMKVEPIAFTDDELRGLQAPALLLIGEQEVIYDPAAALARAKRLVPKLHGELIPWARHDMSYSRHEVVDALILQNFAQDAKGRAA
jgi:pimeloyl-ACP methyl ester carboxylesterase